MLLDPRNVKENILAEDFINKVKGTIFKHKETGRLLKADYLFKTPTHLAIQAITEEGDIQEIPLESCESWFPEPRLTIINKHLCKITRLAERQWKQSFTPSQYVLTVLDSKSLAWKRIGALSIPEIITAVRLPTTPINKIQTALKKDKIALIDKELAIISVPVVPHPLVYFNTTPVGIFYRGVILTPPDKELEGVILRKGLKHAYKRH